MFFIFFTFKIYGHGTIMIQGVEHEKGKIDVKIYMDKKSFLKKDLADESIRKKPTKGEKAKNKLRLSKYNPATRKHEIFVEKKLPPHSK